jgi:hypothetical protein
LQRHFDAADSTTSAFLPASRLPVCLAMPVSSAGVRLAMRTSSGNVADVSRFICRTM